VWTEHRGDSDYVIVAFSVAPGGAVGTPFPLSVLTPGNDFVDQPHAAVAPDGTVTVVWKRASGSVEARRIDPPGTVSGTQPIVLKAGTSGDETLPPRVAVAGDGTASVVWANANSQTLGDSLFDVVVRRVSPAGAPVGAEIPVATDLDNDDADIAVAPDGTATVVWERQFPGEIRPVVRRIAPDGSLPGDIDELSDAPGERPRVTALADGTAVVAWNHSGPSGPIARARTISPVGDLGAPDDLSAPEAFGPRIASAPDGRVVVAWGRTTLEDEPTRDVVETAGSEPRFAVPGAPASVGGTPGLGVIRVDWTAPSSNGGLPVIDYRVTLQPSGLTCTTAELTCTFSGLPGGVPQAISVRARNLVGLGAEATTSATPPVTPVPVPGGGTPPPPALTLTSVRVTPASVLTRVPLRRTAPVRIRAAVNRAATLRVLFDARRPGLRRGRACVAPTRALRRAGARACARFVPSGSLRRVVAAGTHTFTVRGLRVGGRLLRPGRYRVTVIATATGETPRRVTRGLVVRPAAPR
jgi:hypothetical protein